MENTEQDTYKQQAGDGLAEKRSAKSLRTQEALEDFVDSASIGLHWVAPDGTILWANKGDYEGLGYSEEEYVGRSITAFHADEATIADILERLKRGERLRDHPARLRCKDGSIRHVAITSSVRFDEDGRFVHTRCFTRDVTEHRHMEQALRESEERFRALVDGIQDYALFMLDLQGHVRTWSEGAERLYGHPACEIVGRSISLVYPPERVGSGDVEACLSIAEATGRHEEEAWRVRKDGSRLLVSAVTRPVRDAQGRALGFTKITKDVTQQRAIAEERERLLQELKEAVEARDEFLSIASHELRTPLTSVKLSLESLRRAQTSEDIRVHRIHRQVERLAKLVSSLVEVSQITSRRLEFKLEQLDFGELLQDALSQFKEELDRAGCSLHIRMDAGIVGCWDQLRLHQVVANLLSNAIKYGANKPIEVELQQCGPLARLIVRDHGIGISEDDQRRIFERFERAVSIQHYGGFGLGLWITRQIVQGLGGSITVDSMPGRGSTFTVELPLKGPESSTMPE